MSVFRQKLVKKHGVLPINSRSTKSCRMARNQDWAGVLSDVLEIPKEDLRSKVGEAGRRQPGGDDRISYLANLSTNPRAPS